MHVSLRSRYTLLHEHALSYLRSDFTRLNDCSSNYSMFSRPWSLSKFSSSSWQLNLLDSLISRSKSTFQGLHTAVAGSVPWSQPHYSKSLALRCSAPSYPMAAGRLQRIRRRYGMSRSPIMFSYLASIVGFDSLQSIPERSAQPPQTRTNKALKSKLNYPPHKIKSRSSNIAPWPCSHFDTGELGICFRDKSSSVYYLRTLRLSTPLLIA